MRHVVAAGMFWMILNVILGKGASFAAQIALGWMLSKGDFGLYAIAISFSGLLMVFRDGGARQILAQRHADYPAIRGPVFWMCVAFNAATALALLAATPIAVRIYGQKALYTLLSVIAAAVVVSPPSTLYLAKLSADLRFRKATQISVISTLLRHATTILFAACGLGPLSFVLPLPLVALYEGLAGFAATRDKPWQASPQFAMWAPLFASAKWIIAGGLASLLIVSGDCLAIGWVKTGEIVGVYFFAYHLAVQIHILLAGNLQSVLLPALARFQGQPARQGAAMLKSLDAIAIFTFPVTMWLALCAQPIERLIWHGRWAAAVPVVQILCIALSYRSITAAVKSLLESQGAYRTYFYIGMLDGLANVLAGLLGSLAGDLQAIAIAIAIYSAVSSLGQGCFAARRLGFSFTTLLKGHAIPWMLALAAALAAFAFARYILPPLHPALDVLVRSAVFALVYVPLLCLVLRGLLREMLAILPSRRTSETLTGAS